ncbi:MAG TPA: DUF6484 domain-containing protein [Anaeromyxobacter sp.]|nr:DUF6484 domain-containing protein [Anaeromyxobacter sp.]
MKPAKRHAPVALAEVLAHPGSGIRVGVVAGEEAGAPLVELPGAPGGPVRARSMIALGADELADAVARRREVVLLLEDGDPGRPIVAGFLEAPSATPRLDAALEATLEARPDVAVVDGRRVVIDAEDEVVLRCGEASITLRRNGKIVVRGLYVETHAAGTNRIKGGSVKIN